MRQVSRKLAVKSPWQASVLLLLTMLLMGLLIVGTAGCGSEAQTKGSPVGGAGGSDSGGSNEGGSTGGGGGSAEEHGGGGSAEPMPAVFAVVNVRAGQSLHSGFIAGTAPADTASVEVALDGGGFMAAEGTGTWRFKLPTGPDTWRHATAHTVAVRYTDAGAVTSEPIALTIRKGANRDVNGDGFPDLMVGAPAYDGFRGRVYIFEAGGSWNSGASSVANPNGSPTVGMIYGNPGAGGIGHAIALGDLNGDGYADLVIGAHLWNGGNGRVHVVYSAGDEGIPPTNPDTADAVIEGEADSSLGSAVAIGDVDGDGYDDLIAGADGSTINRVYIFLADGSGISASNAAADADTIIDGSGYFGTTLAVADVNGDGIQDVLAGDPLGASYHGAVYIFKGVAGTGVTATSIAAAQPVIVGAGEFGWSIATGDFDNDGYVDLAVGDSDAERVYIFGSQIPLGLPDSSGPYLTTVASADVTISNPATSGLGGNVAVGDVNGDGIDDLVAGTGRSSYTLEERVYIFHGANSTGITASSTNQANTMLSGDNGRFGNAIAVTDANRDGFGDVAVGAWTYDSHKGRLYLFASAGKAGVPHSASVPATAVINAQTGGSSQLGWAIAGP